MSRAFQWKNIFYGHNPTHKISLANIIQHTLSVKKGINNSLLVVDMPKNTYKNNKNAFKNATLFLKQTGCDAIKLENHKDNFKIIKYLVSKKR